jgi:hypothetical protein
MFAPQFEPRPPDANSPGRATLYLRARDCKIRFEGISFVADASDVLRRVGADELGCIRVDGPRFVRADDCNGG